MADLKSPQIFNSCLSTCSSRFICLRAGRRAVPIILQRRRHSTPTCVLEANEIVPPHYLLQDVSPSRVSPASPAVDSTRLLSCFRSADAPLLSFSCRYSRPLPTCVIYADSCPYGIACATASRPQCAPSVLVRISCDSLHPLPGFLFAVPFISHTSILPLSHLLHKSSIPRLRPSALRCTFLTSSHDPFAPLPVSTNTTKYQDTPPVVGFFFL